MVRAEGTLFTELRLPVHFQQVAELVHEEDLTQTLVCGPDPEKYATAVQEFVEAGFDYVSARQIGPDQEGFFRFYERDVLPRFRSESWPSRR